MIYLEPRSIFDRAIIKEDIAENRLIYCRDKLIDVLMDAFEKNNPEIPQEELYLMAVEHIEYNIERSAPYYENWPLIQDT